MAPSFLKTFSRKNRLRKRRFTPRYCLARPVIECLDERVLPSVSTDLSAGILSIHADNNPNQVQVLSTNQGIQVMDFGQTVGTFSADQVNLIAFQYGAGQSIFDNQSGVASKELRLFDSAPLTPDLLSQTGTLDALLVGDTLSLAGPSGAGFQITGNWTATDQVGNNGLITHAFTAFGLMALQSALGPIPFPSLDSDPLQIATVAGTQPAAFGAVASISWNTGAPVDTTDPNSPLAPFAQSFGLHLTTDSASFGVALGSSLGGLGAPLNSALPYIYLTTSTGTAQLGDIQSTIGTDNPLTLVLDPEDPFIYAQVNEFAVGLSLKGYIPYNPVLPLPSLASNPLYGHLYASGPISLGDVPATIHGSIVANLDEQHDGQVLGLLEGDIVSYLITGRLDFSNLAQANPNDLRIGINGHADIQYGRNGFDMTIPVDASAVWVPGNLDVHGQSTGDFLAGTPLSFLGTSTRVDVLAEVTPDDVNAIINLNTANVNGFTAANVVVDLTGSGFTATADLDLEFNNWSAQVSVSGTVQPDGTFDLVGQAQGQFNGFVMGIGTFELTNSGLTVAGEINVQLGSALIPVQFTGVGYIQPDGQFVLTGDASSTFGDYVSANATYTLTNAGFTAQGDITVNLGTWSGVVHFQGNVGLDGAYRLQGNADVQYAGFASANADFVLTNGGLTTDGVVNVHLGSVVVPIHFAATGFIHPDGNFQLHGTADATFAGYASAGAVFALTNSGLTATGTVDVRIGSYTATIGFSGWVHADGQFSLSGSGQANFAGYVSANAMYTLDNSGLHAMGDATVHVGSQAIQVHFTTVGTIQTNGTFTVDGHASATFAGFVMGNTHFVINNSGLTADGTIDVRIASSTIPINFTTVGTIQSNGTFMLSGYANTSFAGFVAANVHFVIDNSGMTGAGNITFYLGSLSYTVPYSGWIHTDGQFHLTATISSLSFAGFIGGSNVLTWTNASLSDTSAFHVGSVLNSSLTGTIYADHTFSLTGAYSVSFAGFSAGSTFTLNTGGISVAANVNVLHVATEYMTGYLHTDGTFQLTFSGGLNIAGYSGSGSLTLANSGVHAHEDVSFAILGYAAHMDGWIYSNGSFGLDYSSSLHLGPISGSLAFHLGNGGFSVQVHGSFDLTATVNGPFGAHLTVGFRIDTGVSFSVATNGTFSASGSVTATAYLGISLSVGIGFSIDNHTFTIHTHDIGFSVWFISFHPFGDTVIHY